MFAGLKVTRETFLITRANDDIYSPWNSLRAKGGGVCASAPAACSTTSDAPIKQINMLIGTPDEKTGNGQKESDWNCVTDESTGFTIKNR